MSVFYVVHKGRKPGIYNNWNECKKQITNFDGAVFKKFTDAKEAGEFLVNGFPNSKKPRSIVVKENADKKNLEKIDYELNNDDDEKIFIYTDGSCTYVKNNPTKAGYGIYIPQKNIEISSPLTNQKLTNNRAELTAIIESIKHLDDDDLSKKICIFTDSQYSMYIFNGTGEKYQKNNWKNNGSDVPNIDLIKKMLELKKNYNIVLLKVRAHTDKKDTHSLCNAIADKLATDGANDSSNNNNNNLFYVKNKKNNKDNDDNDEDNNDDEFDNNKSYIDKNIQINELFDFDVLENNENNVNKKLKNQKLSNWFVKK